MAEYQASASFFQLTTQELRTLILLHVREEARLLGEADALGACDGHNLYTEAADHRTRAEAYCAALTPASRRPEHQPRDTIMALKQQSSGMAKSTTSPGPEFDEVKKEIKASGQRVTPFRLGYFSRGVKANPYSKGSQAHGHFKDGAEWSRRHGKSVLR